jgi:hypothetical protein
MNGGPGSIPSSNTKRRTLGSGLAGGGLPPTVLEAAAGTQAGREGLPPLPGEAGTADQKGNTSNGGRVRIDPTLLAHANDGQDVFDLMHRDGSGAATGSGSGNGSKPGQEDSPNPSGSTDGSSKGRSGSPTTGNLSPALAGVGLPSLGGGAFSASSKTAQPDSHPTPTRSQRSWELNRPRTVEVPLDMTVVCGPDGAVVHPGGYRLSKSALNRPGMLQRDLDTIVRNHELVDPYIRPRPRVEFLVEPGGDDTFAVARKQTVLAGHDWPVTIRVARPTAPAVFPRERF